MGHIARRIVLLMAAAVIALLALAACGGDDEGPEGDGTDSAKMSPNGGAGALSVVAADYSFDAPEAIAPGPTTVEFTNEGEGEHELRLLRLNDGVAFHQFQQTLHQDGLDTALEMGWDGGSVAAVAPGETAETLLDLTPGEYVLICQLETPDGEAYALKGMTRALTVTDS